MNTSLFRYKGCALPNVYLVNGYEIISTPYGEGVKIHDLEGLHAAIGEAVVSNPAPLTGQEFRFLRQELDLSQAALGGIIGRSEQSVARWEKGSVDPAADRLMRIFYCQTKMGGKPWAPALKFLQELESKPPEPKRLVAQEIGSTWNAMPAAKCA